MWKEDFFTSGVMRYKTKNVKSLNEFLIKKLFFNNVFYKQKELIKEIFKQFYENKLIFYRIFINKIIRD